MRNCSAKEFKHLVINIHKFLAISETWCTYICSLRSYMSTDVKRGEAWAPSPCVFLRVLWLWPRWEHIHQLFHWIFIDHSAIFIDLLFMITQNIEYYILGLNGNYCQMVPDGQTLLLCWFSKVMACRNTHSKMAQTCDKWWETLFAPATVLVLVYEF